MVRLCLSPSLSKSGAPARLELLSAAAEAWALGRGDGFLGFLVPATRVTIFMASFLPPISMAWRLCSCMRAGDSRCLTVSKCVR